MKLVKQNPNHCVPACLASILSDQDIGIDKSQDEIVKDNPEVFNKEGVLIDSYKLESVFKKYGVSVCFKQEDKSEKYDIKKLKHIASNSNNKILLIWRAESNHCVHFLSIKSNGDIEVMDPQRSYVKQTHMI